MAVVHFATRGLIPVKPWTVPGGISSLDVPDRIVGRGTCILRQTTRTAARPPNNQEQKKSETSGNEGERRQATWKASGHAAGWPSPRPQGECPGGLASAVTTPPLH